MKWRKGGELASAGVHVGGQKTSVRQRLGEMSAKQGSAMVVECYVDEAGLESTSCLLLDFPESFALRSLW